MAFYGGTSRHGQRRAWQWIFSESPVTMCQTSENGQDGQLNKRIYMCM